HGGRADIPRAADQGLVSGYDNHTYRAEIGRFRPTVTRGQALQMLWRLAGSPAQSARHPWSHGPPWLRPALRWGGVSRVMTGYGDGTFRPDNAVTRGALAGALWRVAGSPTGYGPHPWTDVPARLHHAPRWGPPPPPRPDAAARWAHATGVLAGLADGTLGIQGTVDRAQVAVLLHRTFDAMTAGGTRSGAMTRGRPGPEPTPTTTPTTVPPPTTTVAEPTTTVAEPTTTVAP